MNKSKYIIEAVEELKSQFPSIPDDYAILLIDRFFNQGCPNPVVEAGNYIRYYQTQIEQNNCQIISEEDQMPIINNTTDGNPTDGVEQLKELFPGIDNYYADRLINFFVEKNSFDPFSAACDYIRNYQRKLGIVPNEVEIPSFFFFF
jgi:hypothetical protein